ncbi:MAG: ATP-binding protein [Chloroflexi bacterium]|nr:ATP-binding protein [Chloroflexota bacterium]MCI0574694.1 ATP-binding protein [Chloroflexota bacterium]MCI0647413.1 ATP-binding protein [Chloroflexota bacterium]MCI0725272.1 ATP-binding protein [Chloroflexota bacterium]
MKPASAAAGLETTSATPFASSLEEILTALAYVDLRVRWAVARARAAGLDPDDEFRGLYISEAQVDNLLGSELGGHLWSGTNGYAAELEGWAESLDRARRHWQARTEASRQAGPPLLLDRLAQRFGLSPAEVDALLLALAPELDPRYERLFAYLQDDVTKKRPSVDLILNLLTGSFTEKVELRRLFTDDGRLFSSRLLVRFSDGGSREPTLLSQAVRPAAAVVEYLSGHPALDSQLATCAQLLFPAAFSIHQLAPDLAQRVVTAVHESSLLPPLFAFRGSYGVGKREAALLIAQTLGQPLLVVDLPALDKDEAGRQEGLRLAVRDGCLLGAVLYLDHWDTILEDDRPPAALLQLLLDYPGVVIVAGETVWQPVGRERSRPVLSVAFTRGGYEERLVAWQRVLGNAAGLPLAELANQFQFTPGQIAEVAATARDLARWRQASLAAPDLFDACRAHSNQKLATLATKIQPRYHWRDIVLPADTVAQLREMVNTVRQRPTVYGQWGFGQKLALGKGLNALFAGESGTGKTMAADIMAGELGQDLYKIDLSMLVSKYIGETEKNLNRVFTEAATSNAILFFDEADAIFGKRSEVKDSHDRYANIEISYLLQRMEAYDGVVILATNMRANLDEAFTRRLHFIVEFPFPEAADREIIWQVNFPSQTPLAADVNFKLLAERFRLAGGNIRNIIMAAAFLAAEAGEAVGMKQLLHATRREYQKIGRLLDEQLWKLE